MCRESLSISFRRRVQSSQSTALQSSMFRKSTSYAYDSRRQRAWRRKDRCIGCLECWRDPPLDWSKSQPPPRQAVLSIPDIARIQSYPHTRSRLLLAMSPTPYIAQLKSRQDDPDTHTPTNPPSPGSYFLLLLLLIVASGGYIVWRRRMRQSQGAFG